MDGIARPRCLPVSGEHIEEVLWDTEAEGEAGLHVCGKGQQKRLISKIFQSRGDLFLLSHYVLLKSA